ncbi:MAG TPA: hypothetical protein VGO55_03245 [Allosphingosinicella sp.]|jgi:hypothetical protein|nr:hypothetical protein [Allosphingosinicella sp.]
MAAYLIQIDGYDPIAGAAVSLRASSVNDDRVCHLDGANGVWWPALAQLPELRYDLIDGGFSGRIATPDSQLALSVEAWPNLPRYNLADARVRIWAGNPGDAWGAFVLRFDGRTRAQPTVTDGRASIPIGVDDKWLDKPLLALYAGTGGAEGDAPLKGQPKPLALGAPRFVPGLLVDTNSLIFQMSAYGLIEDIEVAFERILRFQASAGDYASHAALAAATIPAGAWATCKAEGKVRHGAPPVQGGRFVYHVKGDKAGPDGWVRLPGAMIKRIALIGGGTGRFSEASVDALDIARPWNVSFFSNAQITIREAIQRIAASVNAIAGVSWLSQLFVAPIPSLVGAASVTLDATGASLPPTDSVDQIPIDPPFWRMAIETEKTWDVHEYGDIAFTSVLVDRGPYVSTDTYREGNIVQDQGVNWFYINATPGAGNAPPTLPATSNAYWKGTPAGPTVTLTADVEAFTFTDGVATPGGQTINFAAARQNSSETVTFSTSPAVTLTGTGLTRALSAADFGANRQVVVTATGATSGAKSTKTIMRLERWTSLGGLDPSAAAALAAIADDNILDMGEKTDTLLPKVAELGARYAYLVARATALGLSTTAVATSQTNFLSYLAALSPSYDDVNQNTTLSTNLITGVFPAGWATNNGLFSTSGIYQLVTDANAGAFAKPGFTIAVNATGTVTFAVVVKKDAIPKTTRSILIGFENTAGTIAYARIVIATDTGTVIFTDSSPSAYGCYALSETEWLIWTTAPSAAYTSLVVNIYPSPGADIAATGYQASQMGSVYVRDPVAVLGPLDKAGRDVFKYRFRDLQAELDALAKAVSEKDGATSLQIDGKSTINVPATYLGDASASLPISTTYTAKIGTGAVTGAWTRTVISGTITCTVGAATGVLDITAMGSASAIVRLDCTYNGVLQSKTVQIPRVDADAPSGGGGGGNVSSVSVYGTINSGTYTTIATLTHTAGSTTVALSAPDLVIAPVTVGGNGSWDIQFKWVREAGAIDVDVGSASTSNPDPDVTGGVMTEGYAVCSASDTGRTATTVYTYYLMARINSGAARTMTITGSGYATS